jgi:hypothetical protein
MCGLVTSTHGLANYHYMKYLFLQLQVVTLHFQNTIFKMSAIFP